MSGTTLKRQRLDAATKNAVLAFAKETDEPQDYAAMKRIRANMQTVYGTDVSVGEVQAVIAKDRQPADGGTSQDVHGRKKRPRKRPYPSHVPNGA